MLALQALLTSFACTSCRVSDGMACRTVLAAIMLVAIAMCFVKAALVMLLPAQLGRSATAGGTMLSACRRLSRLCASCTRRCYRLRAGIGHRGGQQRCWTAALQQQHQCWYTRSMPGQHGAGLTWAWKQALGSAHMGGVAVMSRPRPVAGAAAHAHLPAAAHKVAAQQLGGILQQLLAVGANCSPALAARTAARSFACRPAYMREQGNLWASLPMQCRAGAAS